MKLEAVLQNPRYLIARMRQVVFQRQHPSAPWLVPAAVEILDQIIRPTDICVEFGSGRSTRWLAIRCAKLIAVEHDEGWFRKVLASVADLENVDLRLCRLTQGQHPSQEYGATVESLDNHSIDLILNDGKHRDAVAVHGANKLRPGGVMIIDNAERYLPNDFSVPESRGPDSRGMSPQWKQFQSIVDPWRRIWVSDGVSTTLILFKP